MKFTQKCIRYGKTVLEWNVGRCVLMKEIERLFLVKKILQNHFFLTWFVNDSNMSSQSQFSLSCQPLFFSFGLKKSFVAIMLLGIFGFEHFVFFCLCFCFHANIFWWSLTIKRFHRYLPVNIFPEFQNPRIIFFLESLLLSSQSFDFLNKF